MGSKKHKKHHKSDKRDAAFEGDRQEKPLKLVLKVAGSSIQAPTANAPILPPVQPGPSNEEMRPPHSQEHKSSNEKEKSSSHSHEKHKKSKKKKKKKSSEKDKDRHEKKRKHHHHHHHHREHSHDRKEKRKREQQELNRSVVEAREDNSVLQKTALLDTQVAIPIEKPLRDPRTCTLKKKTLKTPLQIMLYYMLKKLQLKDPQDFFAWPVTNSIAPGYSEIIKNPIDFSTMKKKIDDREYETVMDFKSDIKLMCDNAMTYNGSDTIYYKSARKMWHAAQKLMSRDQLILMKRSMPYLSDLTEKELGVTICEDASESFAGAEIAAEPCMSLQPEAKKTKVAPSWNSIEADVDMDDELSPEDILAEAQKAAKAAAEKLTLKRPNSKFGFLRQQENGTTTLSILHPKSSEQTVKVNLEMLTGKLNQGTGTIVGFKEDSKNIIKPVSYTNYGAYTSYAPHYDSMFTNLNKEESELVLSTYGDEPGIQYADSIMSYAKDSDYVMTMVDNMLDVLTGGEHSKTVKILEERRKMREEEQQHKKSDCNTVSSEPKTTLQSNAEKAEAESIQALNDINLEMSMLETVETENSLKRKADKMANKHELLQKHKKLLTQRKAIQQKLDNATQLLQDLRKVQNERLSATPPSHLSLVQGASLAETDLADKLSKKIADIASQLPPESVTSVDGLRKAMGITCQPKLSSVRLSAQSVSTSSKHEQAKRTETSNTASCAAVQPASPFEPSSPVRETGSRHMTTADMDTELQQFLETGPMLRVCDSPTGS